MGVVRSWGELDRALKDVRSKALQDAAKKAVEYVQDTVIEQEVYGAGSPEFYQRTYDLKNSVRDNPVEGGMGRAATVKIDHDISQISVNLSAYQHGSPYSGGIADAIPMIVHDGLSGSMFGDGYWMQPRPYMGTARNALQGGYMKRYMINEFLSMGFRAS